MAAECSERVVRFDAACNIEAEQCDAQNQCDRQHDENLNQ